MAWDTYQTVVAVEMNLELLSVSSVHLESRRGKRAALPVFVAANIALLTNETHAT